MTTPDTSSPRPRANQPNAMDRPAGPTRSVTTALTVESRMPLGGYVQRVLAGCRYRACPIPGRGALLARTSGWAPVVLNDALRTSQDAHTAGEKISDTQVQPRVVTLAKTTAARQWLGGVAPVALVAACRDARRACPG